MWGPAWSRLGDAAMRTPRPPEAGAAELVAALRAWPRVRDVVVTDEWIAVYFHPAAPPADPQPAIAAAAARASVMGREHEIEVRYDGPDLETLADRLGIG